MDRSVDVLINKVGCVGPAGQPFQVGAGACLGLGALLPSRQLHGPACWPADSCVPLSAGQPLPAPACLPTLFAQNNISALDKDDQVSPAVPAAQGFKLDRARCTAPGRS